MNRIVFEVRVNEFAKIYLGSTLSFNITAQCFSFVIFRTKKLRKKGHFVGNCINRMQCQGHCCQSWGAN